MAAHRSAGLRGLQDHETPRSVWCGAGAVSAAVSRADRRQADRLAGEFPGRSGGPAARRRRRTVNMSSAGGGLRSAAPGLSPAVTRSRARDHGHRHARRLALDQVRGGGDLVGDRVQGDLQRVAEAVLGAPESTKGRTPAAPIAVSVCPIRHARPSVSVMTTPMCAPGRARSAFRSRRADSSGSSGSRTTVPGGVLEASSARRGEHQALPGLALMRASPRRATTRTVSASIAASRSPWTTRPSAWPRSSTSPRRCCRLVGHRRRPRSARPGPRPARSPGARECPGR